MAQADDPIIPHTSDEDSDVDDDDEQQLSDYEEPNQNIADLPKIDTAPNLAPKLETRTTDAPSTPAPKPPAITTNVSMSGSNFDRHNTPKSPAPKPPASFSSANSQHQLISIREDPESGDGMQKPVFNDYTQLCCCLIFFFAWSLFIIVAYWKARNAVQAYRQGNYGRYKLLNTQARMYMVTSVTVSVLIVCASFIVSITVLETRAPDADVEEVPEA